MAVGLPPPPINDKPGSYTWMEWYRQLRNYVSTSGSVPWYIINFAGSNITDIAQRNHENLQGLQGGAPSQHYHLTSAEQTAASHQSWNTTDGTIDIAMGLGGGVTQQVGLEQYMVVKNITGSTLLNGKCIGFAGSSAGRATGHYMIADGSMPSLHALGVATMDITNGNEGYVTTYGYVRDLDTSAWSMGDILYVSPTVAGNLTNVKPTAPNLVIPIAVVLVSSATVGVLVVRPTLTLELKYGSFINTTSLTAAAINTAYAATFNTTLTSAGVSVGTPTSRIVTAVAGQYDFTVNVQAVKSSASVGYLWVWARRNGVDIPSSATKVAIQGSTGEATISRSYPLTMQAGDYFEVMWAVDSTAISLQANAATAFCPATPAVTLSVAQVNQ